MESGYDLNLLVSLHCVRDDFNQSQPENRSTCAVRGKFYLLPKKWRRIYAVLMSRGLRNWNYRQVVDFLRANGFRFAKELGGSHQAWIKLESEVGPETRVEVNHTHSSYPIKTLKTMIRQSGINQAEWIKWGDS